VASPLMGTRVLSPQHKQSFGVSFLIVYFAYSFEILRHDSSRCNLFKKLSLIPMRVSISEWLFVEHRERFTTLHFCKQ
jgi:hypothetical protein